MKYRIIEKNNKYYPQYFCNGIFGLFKTWNYYFEEDLLLNGIYTELIKNKISFNKKELAINFLKNKNGK